MNDDEIIDHIKNSLLNFNLRDIKLICMQDTVIASFILCSCFIEQVSTFRYGKDIGKKEFFDFVEEYLPKSYNSQKLRDDLRNRLVHNYSVGKSYGLVQRHPELHLVQYEPNRYYLNLENFINDLDRALTKYITELKENKGNLRQLALDAYSKVNIIGLSNHV